MLNVHRLTQSQREHWGEEGKKCYSRLKIKKIRHQTNSWKTLKLR